MLNECNVIYECKVCFNMFRSIANLIAHKRSFCRSRCKNVRHIYSKKDEEDGRRSRQQYAPNSPEEDKVALVYPEPVETVMPEEKFELEKYSPSIELLQEAGIMADIEEKPLVTSLLPHLHDTKRSKLSSIVGRLRELQDSKEEAESIDPILLEHITQTRQAVFQTKGLNGPTMGQRYVALQKALQAGTIFVGPDNRIIDPGIPSRSYSPVSISTSCSSYRPSNTTSGDGKYYCPVCSVSRTRLYNIVNHLRDGKLAFKLVLLASL